MAKKKPIVMADPAKDPIFMLPPYKVEQVFATYTETMDWGLELMDIPNLWRQSKGEGAKVAVLDTGIADNHPDLRDAIKESKDFTRSRSGTYDKQGHGTHVAGTIAARENSSGVIGVAPKCQLLIGKVLGDNGSGSAPGIAEGIRWAVEKGAHIISMSLGAPVEMPLIHEAITEAVAAGVFVIAAAGNEGPSIDTVGWPARWENVIAVGSIDRRKRVSQFSSRGRQVDIVAPGDQILSCYPPTGLAKLSGTSMATPFVSGVVALKVSRNLKFPEGDPIDTQEELMQVLRESATDMHIPGRDNHYGYGIIDPARLLKYGTEPPEDGSSHAALLLEQADLSDTGRVKLATFLEGIAGADEIEIRLKTK
jgi:subtilisin family serine protease